MSEALNAKVDKKRDIILDREEKVKEMRAELIKLKTDNVKKIITLENLEAKRKK